MPYYVLNNGFALRGWKGKPFGLGYPNPHFVDFFDKESYEVVYALDGRHDIREDELSEKQKKLLKRLIEKKIAIESDGTKTIESYQEYKTYPAMYKRSATWSITGRCNYKCRHCFMSAPDYHGEDLNMEQCRHILDEIDICGIRSIALTGGEALVNPHFFEILDELEERYIILDTVYSNGLLVNDKLFDEFEKRNMHPNIHLSFDGVGWHDWLRGVKGAEEDTIRAFRLAKERGYQTSASMCLHKHNISSLRETVNLLGSLGLVHLKMNVATPSGRWKNESEHFITQDEANEAILEYIPQYVEDGMPLSVQFCGFLEFDKEKKVIMIPFRKFSGVAGADKASACGAVKTSLYISPQGKVLPCMTLGGTAIDPMFDSILEKPLSEILSDSYYRDVCLTKMGECIEHNERCRECKYKLMCGAGCRACACGETSTDYLGIDEETCLFYKHGWYEKAREVIEKYQKCFPDNGEDKAPTDLNLDKRNRRYNFSEDITTKKRLSKDQG